MGKTSTILFLFFLLLVSAFGYFNQEVVTVRIPWAESYEVSKFILVLLSIATGVFITFIFFVIRDTKRFIDNWQYQKKQKHDLRVQGLYSKALNALISHREADARDLLADILAEEPDHIDALLRSGEIAGAEEDFQKANTFYQKARMINPQNIETLFAIEGLLERMSRWTEALKYLDDILEIDDANLTALYRKRGILERQGRWDDIVYLQKTIIKYENSEKLKRREQNNLTGFEYEYGRHSLENNQLEKAKKAFKSVLRVEKDFTPATLGLAEAMLREGESEEAVNLLEKAYETTASKIVLARLEDLLISLGEPSRLINIYRAGILRHPGDPVTKFFLGKLFYRLEMIDDAFEALSGIDAGSLQYPELHQLLGNLYLRRGQPDQAVREYQQVIDIKKTLRLPYCCTQCGFSSEEWSGRCPDCKTWDTYQLNLAGTCSAMTPPLEQVR